MPRTIESGSARAHVADANKLAKAISALLTHCQDRAANALNADAGGDLKLAGTKAVQLAGELCAAMNQHRRDRKRKPGKVC